MTCVDNNAFAENLKYCQFVSLIIYIYIGEKSRQGSILSGNSVVGETTCSGKVLSMQRLLGKQPEGKTSG